MNVETVRLLVPDIDETDYIFTDEQYNSLLELSNGSAYRAAANALRAIAGNQALALKTVRTDDLQVDGAKVADSLRKLAEEYDRRASEDEKRLLDEGFSIIFPETAPYIRPEATPWPYYV